jgi:hypothetical protein
VDFTAAIAAQAMPIAIAIRRFAAQADLDEIRRVEDERAATIQRLEEEERRLSGEDPANKAVEWYDRGSGNYFLLRHDEPRDGPGFRAWAREWAERWENTERSPDPFRDYPEWFARAKSYTTDAERARRAKSFKERLRLSADQTREAASTIVAQRGLIAALSSGAVVAYGRQSAAPTKRLISRETWSGDWTLATSDNSARRATPEARFDDLSFVEVKAAATLGNRGQGRKPSRLWPPVDLEFLKRLLSNKVEFATATELCDEISEIAAKKAPKLEPKNSSIRDHFVSRYGRFGWRGLFTSEQSNAAGDLGYWQRLDGGFLLRVKRGARPTSKREVLKMYFEIASDAKLSPPREDELCDHLRAFWTRDIWAMFPEEDQAR